MELEKTEGIIDVVEKILYAQAVGEPSSNRRFCLLERFPAVKRRIIRHCMPPVPGGFQKDRGGDG